MPHIQVTIHADNPGQQELLIAHLSEEGFEGFEQTESALQAYIDEEDYNEALLQEIATAQGVTYTTRPIAEENWNATWEANFEPVIVAGFCTIRADFHTMLVNTPYEVVITPKMSFGTGHHATTQLMLQLMQHLDMQGKQVLDLGTGTGILAIMAHKLGAAAVLAIDNDNWAYENAQENVKRNLADRITVVEGTLDAAAGKSFDSILANINRHILLDAMPALQAALRPGGTLLLSGLLTEDHDIIHEAASAVGLKQVRYETLTNWIALQYEK